MKSCAAVDVAAAVDADAAVDCCWPLILNRLGIFFETRSICRFD